MISMKRSEVNRALSRAQRCFDRYCRYLPPVPRWEVTDFGLRDFSHFGLTWVTLAEGPDYGEKLLYAHKFQRTPAHCHRQKTEELVVQMGYLALQVWLPPGFSPPGFPNELTRNGQPLPVSSGEILTLEAGERLTLPPRVYHEFWPLTEECILSELNLTGSTTETDAFFRRPDIGIHCFIIEDEPAHTWLERDQ
jgi:D-lyxose ketol-isomerase